MEKQEQPMTEQQFLRVLTKNIAGILLCLAWMMEPGRLQSMGSQRVGHD